MRLQNVGWSADWLDTREVLKSRLGYPCHGGGHFNRRLELLLSMSDENCKLHLVAEIVTTHGSEKRSPMVVAVDCKWLAAGCKSFT